jgi:phenylalanyl-tRNA synthetase alpha chain
MAPVTGASTAPNPHPVPRLLEADELARALAVADHTDPAHGAHAVARLLGEVVAAVAGLGPSSIHVHRGPPITSIADNYDVLGIGPDAVTRDARYTRYVTADSVLRTHTSALVAPALREMAERGRLAGDTLVVCPGVVYRRDAVDRLHSATPHQVDLWWLRPNASESRDDDLVAMAAAVVGAATPQREWRLTPATHPYTRDGHQLDVAVDDGAGGQRWVELAECGRAAPEVLSRCGLDPTVVSGLALGLGLDRAVMVRKRIDDIRLLRSPDPRVRAQLADLEPYRAVSACPAMIREISIAVSTAPDDESLGDQVRSALDEADADLVEEVSVVGVTPITELPPKAVERLGASAEQVNALVRVVLRRLDRALTGAEANRVRDSIATAIHEGTRPV